MQGKEGFRRSIQKELTASHNALKDLLGQKRGESLNTAQEE